MNNNIENVVKKLILNKETISTMESCTGGALANEITNIEGSSEIIKFSAVTYSNEFKIKMGVNKETIDKYSVYSIEVAKEMSKCISDFTSSTYGIGITGKLNRIDKNNLQGNDNEVFVSIYNRKTNEYKTISIIVDKETRQLNKKDIVNKIAFILSNSLS